MPEPTAPQDPAQTQNVWQGFTDPQDFAGLLANMEGQKPGSVAVRNNNPGNLKDANGQFMKFPTPEAGQQALIARMADWQRRFPDMTVAQFNRRYAPDTDNPKGTEAGRNRRMMQEIGKRRAGARRTTGAFAPASLGGGVATPSPARGAPQNYLAATPRQPGTAGGGEEATPQQQAVPEGQLGIYSGGYQPQPLPPLPEQGPSAPAPAEQAQPAQQADDRVRVKGPDGKPYAFPKGTDKQTMVKWFRARGIMPPPQVRKPPVAAESGGFGAYMDFLKSGGQHRAFGALADKYAARARSEWSRGSYAEALADAAANYGATGAQVLTWGEQLLAGLAEPKNAALFATALLVPPTAIPIAGYYTAQALKGVGEAGNAVINNPSADNIMAFGESVMGTMLAVQGVKESIGLRQRAQTTGRTQIPALAAASRAFPKTFRALADKMQYVSDKTASQALEASAKRPVDYNLAAGRALVREGIKGGQKNLADLVQQAGVLTDAQIAQQAAALRASGATANVGPAVDAEINDAINEANRLGVYGRMRGKIRAIEKQVKEIPGAPGQPGTVRNLHSINLDELAGLRKGLESVGKIGREVPAGDMDVPTQLARNLHRVLSDHLAQASPELANLITHRDGLYGAERYALELRNRTAAKTARSLWGIFRSRAGIATYFMMHALGMPWITDITSGFVASTLWENTRNKLFRARLYNRVGEHLESYLSRPQVQRALGNLPGPGPTGQPGPTGGPPGAPPGTPPGPAGTAGGPTGTTGGGVQPQAMLAPTPEWAPGVARDLGARMSSTELEAALQREEGMRAGGSSIMDHLIRLAYGHLESIDPGLGAGARKSAVELHMADPSVKESEVVRAALREARAVGMTRPGVEPTLRVPTTLDEVHQLLQQRKGPAGPSILEAAGLTPEEQARVREQARGEAERGEFLDEPSRGIEAEKITGGGKWDFRGGANVERLGGVLGSSLYHARGPGVVIKELLQNAYDATRGLQPYDPKGHVDAFLDARNRDAPVVIVSDNGIGMTPEQVQTIFVDLGEEGKPGQPGASGGFGLAKAAIFKIPEKTEVTTVTKNTEQGWGLIRTRFVSTPQTFYKRVSPTVEYLPEGYTNTGTTVKATFGKGAETWPASDFLKNAMRSTNAPATLTAREQNYWDNQPSEIQSEGLAAVNTHVADVDQPGVAHYSVYKSNVNLPMSKEAGKIEVEVQNNGIYQFTHENWLGGATKLRGMPSRIVIDVKSHAAEGEENYPFEANREKLRDVAANQVNRIINDHFIEPLHKALQQQIAKMYHNLPIINLPNTSRYAVVYDSGGRMTPAEMQEFVQNPSVIVMADAIHQTAMNFANKLQGSPFGTAIGEPTKVLGAGVERVGLVLSEKVFGVNVPNIAARGKNTVFINPFAYHFHLPGPEFTTPDAIAGQVFQTISHEVLHDLLSGHNERFTSGEAKVYQYLGADLIMRELARLRDAYQRTRSPELLQSTYRALQLYQESRGRAEVTPDILGGESESGQQLAPGAGGALSLPTGGAQIVGPNNQTTGGTSPYGAPGPTAPTQQQ